MQVVIALPSSLEMERLEMPVCGVPLLTRVIATAVRAGGSNLLLVTPPEWPVTCLTRMLRHAAIESVVVETARVPGPFCPTETGAWRSIEDDLDDRFLWLPCDYVPYKRALSELLTKSAIDPGTAMQFGDAPAERHEGAFYQHPVVLLKRDVLKGVLDRFPVAVVEGPSGVAVRSRANVNHLEAELVRHSGKPTDGIYSRFNRRLCWPAVRWLSHTSITPNTVSFGGLAVAVVSALCFARGTWAWDVAGGLLFFVSGLFDEIDGMLARVKFQESSFGCWLETFVDYATYLLAFAGMTAGCYSRGGPVYVALGAAILFGCLLSFFVISMQRKVATPTKPSEYYQNHLKALDRDAEGNLISKLARNLHFLVRKGVLVHYILLFAVLNLIPVVLFLTAMGANAAWMVTVYLNRRLYLPNNSNQRLAHACAARVEAEQ